MKASTLTLGALVWWRTPGGDCVPAVIAEAPLRVDALRSIRLSSPWHDKPRGHKLDDVKPSRLEPRKPGDSW